jgi:hypothetical protein
LIEFIVECEETIDTLLKTIPFFTLNNLNLIKTNELLPELTRQLFKQSGRVDGLAPYVVGTFLFSLLFLSLLVSIYP